MAEAAVRCPHCQSEAVVKYGEDEQWQGAVSLSANLAVWPDVLTQLCVSWLFAHGEAAGRGHDAQWERDPRYCPSPAGRVQYRDAGIKKKPPGCPR